MSLFESLRDKYNTVGAFYHDAYAEWEVVADPQRRMFEDCRLAGWGETLDEAVNNLAWRKESETTEGS